ncbi:MAG: hypothetical protein FWH25_02390, partial [Syntrophorhabdaceae bacterium]|nr:hypothetical protein [Syntrophorhabdaceae bacterium]
MIFITEESGRESNDSRPPADYKLQATSKNPKLCVTRPLQNVHLPYVNSAFGSVASLDFEVFRGCQKITNSNYP